MFASVIIHLVEVLREFTSKDIPVFQLPFTENVPAVMSKKELAYKTKKGCSHQRAGNQREEWLSTFEVSKVPGEDVIVFQFSFFLENVPVTLSEKMIAEER